MTTTLRNAFIGLSAATAALAASPAMAMDLGCQNADTVRAALRTEGQFVLVTGEATNDTRSRNIFTSNENGSLGYRVEQGSGNTTGQLCVLGKYTDVRVNTNLDSSAPPTWARFGEGTQNDRYFESALRSSGTRILMGARVLIPQTDGSNARGAFMTVSRGNVYNGGAVLVTQNDGSIAPVTTLANLAPQEPNYQNFQARMADPMAPRQ